MPFNYDDPSDPDEGNTGNPGDNISFQELRAHARNLEKQLKALDKEAKDLREYRAASEAASRLGKAKELGLTEGQAKAFLKTVEGEVTPEAVQGFRAELGLAAPETQVATPPVNPGEYPTPQVSVPGFTPFSAGGTFPVKNVITYEQYKELLVKDPQAAIKAVAEDRVEGIYKQPE